MSFTDAFLQSFIPMFVAIDVFGVLPLFLSLTENVNHQRKRRLITQASWTAMIISVLFLLTGQLLFSFLGITEGDFRIAGGILLVVLAIRDMMHSAPGSERDASKDDAYFDTVGVVPIGIPLIMGPAALTTILLSAEAHGFYPTLASLLVNLLIVWEVFRKSDIVAKCWGKSGSRAGAKVMALFLAAVGIMMIRLGYKDLFFTDLP